MLTKSRLHHCQYDVDDQKTRKNQYLEEKKPSDSFRKEFNTKIVLIGALSERARASILDQRRIAQFGRIRR